MALDKGCSKNKNKKYLAKQDPNKENKNLSKKI